MKPSDDPKADRLVNSNINQSNEETKNIYSDKEYYDEIEQEG